jgi:hypothetical protein
MELGALELRRFLVPAQKKGHGEVSNLSLASVSGIGRNWIAA